MAGGEGVSADRREFMAAIAGSALAAGVAGCAGARERPTFVMASTSGAPGGLNPLAAGDEVTQRRLNLLYDGGGVVGDDPIGFEGRWFESWELSEDATRVEYRLRDGLQWGSSGRGADATDYGRLTAETYVYNVENVFRAGWTAYPLAQLFYVAGEPIEYEQTGELTFEAHLPEPRANFLHEDPLVGAELPGAIPLPVDLVEAHAPPEDAGSDAAARARQQLARDPAIAEATIVGNLGPFELETYENGSRMVVRANPDYYLAGTDVDDGAFRGSPRSPGITTQVFEERSTAYAALQAGDVHAAEIEARRKSEMESARGVTLWSTTYGDAVSWISINHRANGWAPLRESREVRQALAHLLDKRALIEDIFDGNANPIDTFHPRWGPYYSDAAIQRYDHDPERARALLESGTSAEYGYADDGTFVGPDGEPVTLRFVTRSDNQTGSLVGDFMRQALAAGGFEVDIEARPFGEILGTYFQNAVANNPDYGGEPDWSAGPYNGGPAEQAVSAEPWDLVYGVGSATQAYAPWQAMEGFVTERGTFNFSGYAAEGFDVSSALRAAAGASTREGVTEELEALFGFLSRDLPFLWTRNNHVIWGYRESVTGLPEVRNAFSRPNVRLVAVE